MKRLLFIFLLPFSLFAQNLQVQSPLRFLALGDSYTIGQSVPVNQRWPVQLKDSLIARGIVTDTMRIIATTGWRTDNLINAITNQHLQQQNYNLVSVLIGVNNQYQGIPLSQYLIEFPQLLDSAIRYAGGDTSHVFIVSIPDYAYTPYGQQSGDAALISQEIDQYNVINKHFADSFHIRYFDITPISRLGIAQPNLVASDGLHPSGIQYSQWVKLILQYIDGGISTGILKNKHDEKLVVYPNPASDKITISFPVTGNKKIEIYDTVGRLCFKQTTSAQTLQVGLKALTKGAYYIHVAYEGGTLIQKFIKE